MSADDSFSSSKPDARVPKIESKLPSRLAAFLVKRVGVSGSRQAERVFTYVPGKTRSEEGARPVDILTPACSCCDCRRCRRRCLLLPSPCTKRNIMPEPEPAARNVT